MQIDRNFLRKLRTVSLCEGISTLILFGVAMPMKYLGDMPMAVRVVGSIHGGLFLVLIFMFALGMKKIPLSPRLAAAGMAGAVVPFGPFLVDRWLGRVGRATSIATDPTPCATNGRPVPGGPPGAAASPRPPSPRSRARVPRAPG